MKPGTILIVRPSGALWYWKGFRTRAYDHHLDNKNYYENVFVHNEEALIFLGMNDLENSKTKVYQFYLISQNLFVTLPSRLSEQSVFNNYKSLNI